MPPIRVLFLCTSNSCRSQMAEGWARVLLPGKVEAFSAGSAPSEVNQLTAQVMLEAGVDISGQRSKHVNEFAGQAFDYVVTLCGDARDTCPFLPGAKNTVHVGFPDPARASGSANEILAEFRRVRNMIRQFVSGIPESLHSVEMWEEDNL